VEEGWPKTVEKSDTKGVDEVEEGKGEEFEGGYALVGVEEKPAAGAKLEAGGGTLPKFEGGAEPAAFIILANGFP